MSPDAKPVHRPTLIRLPLVKERTGLKRSQLYALMRAGEFPRPCKLSQRSSAWRSDEVDAWIDGKIEQRDAAQEDG